MLVHVSDAMAGKGHIIANIVFSLGCVTVTPLLSHDYSMKVSLKRGDAPVSVGLGLWQNCIAVSAPCTDSSDVFSGYECCNTAVESRP